MSQAEAEAIELLARPGSGLAKGGLIAQHAEADPGHLVGQRTDSLVVVGSLLKLESPAAQTRELEALGSCCGGCAQYGSGAMSQQHAKVLVAALADPAKLAMLARGVLLRSEAEPRSKVTGAGEVGDRAGSGGLLQGPGGDLGQDDQRHWLLGQLTP